MQSDPLLKLEKLGQSIWMDFIRRGMIISGELDQRITDDGISGITSNPSIFEKAIAGSKDYDEAVRALALEGKSSVKMYHALAVEDIQLAADKFRRVFDRTNGEDGYVSLEVSPNLAHDTGGTISEARELWKAVNKENVLIKVPGTREGLEAIRELISEGINVNVTLLFGLPRYLEVADAFISGLESRLSRSLSVNNVTSVASFFLSRIDAAVDKILDENAAKHQAGKPHGLQVKGEVAIASAKLAYETYKEIFSNPRFSKLEAHGAKKQRLLWASTSTKNPAYSDIKYVEALIGPETVNTLPLETLNAYRDHGNPAARINDDRDTAHKVIEQLPAYGINLDQITQRLEDDGVRKFVEAYDALINTLDSKRKAALAEPVDNQVFSLGSFESDVEERMVSLEKTRFSSRLWQKDPTLWKSDEASQKVIRNSLGWLHVAEKIEEGVDDLTEFASAVKKDGFKHVVHMGMGGSSLAPLVIEESIGVRGDGIPLTVLDTTDPATVLRIEKEVPIASTLFIVASKSGTTAEPNAFGDYFYERVKKSKGSRAGDNFIAITDPGSKLAEVAKDRHFRRTFLNFADIGGRYSALSYFGLLPAVLLGVDVPELLTRALRMAHACDSCVPAELNPGLMLGVMMGEMALKGKDKITFVVSKEIGTLGLWLEQLIAESTGKEGKGILPVSYEPLLEPRDYGSDRIFAYVRLKGSAYTETEKRVEKLGDAGNPVVTIEIADLYDLGQEFFRWEIATAVAGAILGINAFDQPNVQESKDNTNRLLAEVKKTGKLPDEKPVLQEAGLKVFGNIPGKSLHEILKSFFSNSKPGDYVPLMAYITEGEEVNRVVESIRTAIQRRLHLATTFGYGPRFLHSTGQYHKGGPNTGLFIQLTADDSVDAPLPGQPYSFSVFKRAQAFGDLETLRKHGRRAIRIDLGGDVVAGLKYLEQAVETALR